MVLAAGCQVHGAAAKLQAAGCQLLGSQTKAEKDADKTQVKSALPFFTFRNATFFPCLIILKDWEL
jgi:hypothetical protein